MQLEWDSEHGCNEYRLNYHFAKIGSVIATIIMDIGDARDCWYVHISDITIDMSSWTAY